MSEVKISDIIKVVIFAVVATIILVLIKQYVKTKYNIDLGDIVGNIT